MNKYYETPEVIIEFYTFDSITTVSGEGEHIPGESGGFGDDPEQSENRWVY